jgi:quercetin dioxygenase-like cupin family protein
MADQQNFSPIRFSDPSVTNPEPGLSRRVLSWSPELMLVHNSMEKGWVGARHSHPHQQAIYILKGKIRFTIEQTTFDLGVGDSFLCPGGKEHQASALEESEVLDVFTPYREDYAGTISF